MNSALLVMTLFIVGLLGLSVIGGSLDFGTPSVPLHKPRCKGGDCGRSGDRKETKAPAAKPDIKELTKPQSIHAELARLHSSGLPSRELLERIEAAHEAKRAQDAAIPSPPFALQSSVPDALKPNP